MEDKITVRGDQEAKIHKEGTWKGTVVQQDGKTTNITIPKALYAPKFGVNLLSVTGALMRGWNIGNEGSNLFLQKADETILFDKVLQGKNGILVGVDIVPRTEGEENQAIMIQRGKSYELGLLHEWIGHVYEDVL